MIKIYSETAFFDKFNQNSAFIAPQLTIILILNGEITFEVNDICNTYCKNSLVFISPKNVYKAMGHSADLRMFIAVINRKKFGQILILPITGWRFTRLPKWICCIKASI